MSFRASLDSHLRAIQQRDLQALAGTVADEEIILITAEGKLAQSTREFLDMHRAWFAMSDWKLNVTPVQVYETPGMGVAVLHLDYREEPSGRPPTYQESYLTLVFQERDGRWLMVQDQNTPIKKP